MSPQAAVPQSPRGEAPFQTRLASGQSVQIERIGPDTPLPEKGDSALRELRLLIGHLLTISPVAAEANGISLPTAWVATTPGAGASAELGIAWWTPLPWHHPTAIAEVKLAPGMAATGLGRLLLDLLVLSATERGIEWLEVRVPADSPDLARAIAALRGRPLGGNDRALRFEVPLATGHRRYHRSGIHRRVPRATTPSTRAIAQGD